MNWGAILGLKTSAENLGVQLPSVIDRGLELVAVAEAFEATPPASVLELTDEQARARVFDLSVRNHQGFAASSRGMIPGSQEFRDEVGRAVQAALVADSERMVTELQPRFADIVAPIEEGVKRYGFSFSTKSDDVINLADEQASQAWRDVRTAWDAVRPIVGFRERLSKTLKVAPTPLDFTSLVWHIEEHAVDMTVCFAAGHNWSYDGAYYLSGRSKGQIDWFAMAGGGLRLNTPAEVRAKIAARDAV